MKKIKRSEIKDPFIGTQFVTEEDSRLLVLVFPGSDGGLPENIAKKIALNGFISIAVGYFGLDHLPNHLENIPLEYFKNALEWCKQEYPDKLIVIFGYSRGGELSLILGCTFPGLMDGIIACVPSCYVSGGFPHPNRPAWLLNGQPAFQNYLKGLSSSKEDLTENEDLFLACQKGLIPMHQNSANDPYEIVDLFIARQVRQANEDLMIPVEKMICPLLVLSSEQDAIWPSGIYADLIEKRLSQKGSAIERKIIQYQNSGHGFLAAYGSAVFHPVGKLWCRLGGSQEGNQKASERAWKEIFSFLLHVDSEV